MVGGPNRWNALGGDRIAHLGAAFQVERGGL